MKIQLAAALCLSANLATAQQLDPATMPKIATVSPRFQSYNVEMVEVIGGRFWKPYASTAAAAAPVANATPGGINPNLFEQRTSIDLTNPRLRKLAAALGPAYVRVSGTWANTVYFQPTDAPPPTSAPEGFGGVLTRAQWKQVVAFSKAVDAPIVTSFSTGMGVRDASGLWQPTQAKAFLDYNRSIGGTIAAAEFMNEPTFVSAAGVPKGYDGAAYGRDFAVFQSFFRKAEPHALLLGPGSVGEGIDMIPMKLLPSRDLLTAMGYNPVDVFSYHFYGTVSSRCASGMGPGAGTTPDAALGEDWLARTATVETFYQHLRDEYAPGKSMWLTETGQTACGGDRWASTFLDTFRYLDQMGILAQRSVAVILHNTLAASDYALIDEKTLTPRPSYWAALLWHNTMGTTVLSPGTAPSAGPAPAAGPAPGTTHLYAMCMKNHPGGVTLLALNLSRTASASITLPTASMRYTLSAQDLQSHTVQLNSTDLTLTPEGNLPILKGDPTPKGQVTLAPASITFLTIPEAHNTACK